MTGTTQAPTPQLKPDARRPAAGGSPMTERSRLRARSSDLRCLRIGGSFLIIGSLLWQPMLAWEHLQGLGHRSSSWTWYADQGGFLLTMVLLLIGMAILDRARFTGPRAIGRLALHGLVLAWILLVIAQAGDLGFRWTTADVLTGIGGLLTYPTALVAGIAAVRGGQLTRWRRWALLGLGAYQIGVILVPLLLATAEPSWPAEAGWQLGWFTVGAAAVQQGLRKIPAPPGAQREPA
jgi:hypothetical protein